jgi:hypothetical protein
MQVDRRSFIARVRQATAGEASLHIHCAKKDYKAYGSRTKTGTQNAALVVGAIRL